MIRKKLLICDDDQDILEVLTLVFQAEFDIIAEYDSTKVMDLVRTHSPELIMLDLWMPYLSGDQLIRLLRLGAPGKHARIIAISASPTGEEVSLKAGADWFIPKPFEMHALLAKVRELAALTPIQDEL